MAVKSRKNEYRGVNAHLHSVLQSVPSDWETFHIAYIMSLTRAVNKVLPEDYVVVPERSFQIRALRLDADTELSIQESAQHKPDIAVYDQKPHRPSHKTEQNTASKPTVSVSVLDTMENPEDYLGAVVIRRIANEEIGKPVTWIEVLSPSNKPARPGYRQYREKRESALANGIVMVEIDYLHETRPIIKTLERYPHEKAYPYYIAVSDPYPNFQVGTTDIYGFVVDEPQPAIAIPLSGEDRITVDFGGVYNEAFDSANFYSHLIDYSQEPPRMDSYRADDQACIRSRMAEVIKAQRQAE